MKVEKLKNGKILYHASYKVIEDIDLDCCRNGLDFGKGFYLTSSKDQAIHFLENSVGRAIRDGKIKKQNYGYISSFLYVDNIDLNIKIFESENRDWLHFIASNRSDKVKYKDNAKYDIIGGKIANDFTAKTINIYLTGGYGEVGSKDADEMAIKILLPNKLKDQYCFLTKKSLNNIIYKECEKIEI